MFQRVDNFINDGLAVILDLGYVPDFFELHNDDGTNPDIITWFKEMENLATPEYGDLLTGSTGVVTKLSTAATGVSAYDAAVNGVLVPAPDGNGDVEAAVIEYANASTPTARSVTTVGTIIRPSTRNSFVYECTTSSGAVVTEPTWNEEVGGSTTDDGSNVWITREENTSNSGAKGVSLGASVSQNTDGNRGWYKAEKADVSENKGDAGGINAGQPV